ncbi:MAG TPA: hypothetical protein ENH82_20115 [bacterium]|nr:hypothetical protein [bacterium]
MYIGVEDPNPKIATLGKQYLEDHGIEVEFFPAHLQDQIWKDNAKFFKEKELEALQAKKETAKPKKSILQIPAPGASIISFSDEAIQKFLIQSNATFIYPSQEFDQWAEEFGFIEEDENTKEIKPTGLGIMLFGHQPEITFHQSVFKVEINFGSGKPEIKDFSGPLVLQLPAVIDFVKDKGLKLTMDKSSGKREEMADFPLEVLLEAVANAVIHRDYTIEGATNYLYLDPDKIVVRSPGGPVYPLTLDDLKSLSAPSVSRNPKIMYIFNQMKLAEQRGIGMRNMKELPGKGFPLPDFRMNAGLLEVTFGRTKSYIAEKAGLEDLTEEEKETFLFIQKKGKITKVEFAEEFGLGDKTAQRRLADLVAKGLVHMEGKGKATVYVAIYGY